MLIGCICVGIGETVIFGIVALLGVWCAGGRKPHNRQKGCKCDGH